jgi:hypothetical protein
VRQEACLLAIPADFVIYDEDDAKQVLPQQEQDTFASLLFTFTGGSSAT